MRDLPPPGGVGVIQRAGGIASLPDIDGGCRLTVGDLLYCTTLIPCSLWRVAQPIGATHDDSHHHPPRRFRCHQGAPRLPYPGYTCGSVRNRSAARGERDGRVVRDYLLEEVGWHFVCDGPNGWLIKQGALLKGRGTSALVAPLHPQGCRA
jgi:hypothetical protein